MRTQEMTIEEITSSIQYGPHLKADNKGDVKYYVSSHFDEESKPNLFKSSFLQSSDKVAKYLLKEGDILLTGKGNRLFAWAYTTDLGLVVPSSLFFVLRVKSDIIKGEYLAEMLNSDKMQHQLHQIAAGASILSIPKGELMKLKISTPPISDQEKLCEAAKNLDQNIALTKKLLQQKQILKRGLINKYTNLQTS